MITLKANNLDLLTNAKFSYLLNNYSSGVTSLVLINSLNFCINDYLLLGEFGNETSEIVQIESISGNTLTLKTATNFAHSESTKATILPYNQIRAYHTSTTAFSASELIVDYTNVQADSLYTTIYDITNSTGYGWFVFSILRLLGSSTTQFDITNPSGNTWRYTYDASGVDPDIDSYVAVGSSIVVSAQNFSSNNNGSFTVTAVGSNYFEVVKTTGTAEDNKTIGTGSISLRKVTLNSNYIPYTGFASNSVKKIIEDFYSQLSITEQKLVTTSEVLSWISEAYSVARGELNLVNKEFNAEDHYDLATTANLAEYSLPDNLDYILSVYDDDNDEEVERINIKDIDENNESSSNTTKYYIRGTYVGFSPTPDAAGNYIVRYTTKPADVTSYSDLIVLPGNNHYILKDYIMFRASSRLKRPDGANFLASFYKGIERIKLISNRGGGESSWSIDEHASI